MLVYRDTLGAPEVLLVHPGGPFWRGRDAAAWSIPKGRVEPGETPLAAAQREFAEETGLAPGPPILELTPSLASGGKSIRCWLARADLDLAPFRSSDFEMEWPPRSRRMQVFPEIDRIAYATQDLALMRIHRNQRALILEAFLWIERANPSLS